jgi:hypothetical protein
MTVGEGGRLKEHYYIRCDYCNKKSHPHQLLNFPVFFVDWMTTHLLECDNNTQGKKELVADNDLTIDFGKMKVAHFDAWDTTVSRYLQAVRSSSCKGDCGDKVSMHNFYISVGVEPMQQDSALEKMDKLDLT